MADRLRGKANPKVDEMAVLKARIKALEDARVKLGQYTVTAVDTVAGTYTVSVPNQVDGQNVLMSGVDATSFTMPDVGQVVQLDLVGQQPIYRPDTIAQDAVTGREVAPAAINWAELHGTVVSDIDVILTTANGKNRVTYSVNAPSGSGTRAGDIWWQRQPGQTNVALDATRLTPTAWVAPASSTTVSPTYPTGLTTGDQVYAFLVVKPDTATVAVPTNWTLVGASPALGSGTQGAGTGAVKIHIFKRSTPGGGLTGTQAFTITSGSAPVAHMRAFRRPATTLNEVWTESFSSFSRTTAAADIDGTCTASVAGQAKDEYVVITATSDDEANNIILSSVTSTGLTFDPLVQLPAGTVINAQGNDISAAAAETKVTAGNASATPVLSGGLNTAETGGSVVMRIRLMGDWPAGSEIINSWEWDGAAWQPRVFGDQVLDTLSASKITTGTLDVATQINIGPPTGEHTELGGLGLAYYAPPEGGGTDLLQVARWGKTLGGVSTTTGQQSYAVDNEGNASFTGMNITADPVIQGHTLSYWLEQSSAKVVARCEGWPSPGATTTELGMIELGCVTKPFHLYQIRADGMLPDINGADNQTIRYFARYTTNGTAPTITSTILCTDDVFARFDAFPWENEVAHLAGHYAEGATSHTLRVGLSYANGTGSTSVGLTIDDSLAQRYFTIIDLGLDPGSTGQINHMGGTISGGTPVTPPTNAKRDGEDIIGPAWGKVFRGDGGVFVEGSNGAQGQSTYAPNGNMRTFIGFDSTLIQSILVGAEIRYVRVYTYWNHWYWNAGGYPVFGVHANATAPAGPTGQYALSMAFTNWRVGAASGIWIDLPPEWFGGFANGDFKGIVLGPGPNSSYDYYGKFNGPGAANQPLLAFGWRK